MESIWEKTCRGPARPPLYGKAQADVAVIGGGMTGILTALELQERGLQVVVAEAGPRCLLSPKQTGLKS